MKLFLTPSTGAVRLFVLLSVLLLGLPRSVAAMPRTQDATNSSVTPTASTGQIQLETNVTVADQLVTYTLFPTNIARQSAWNVQIRLPLAPGSAFVTAAATPPFATTFDGKAVIFYAAELAPRNSGGPLVFQVAQRAATTSTLTIQPELSWQTVRTVMRQSELSPNAAQGQPLSIQADGVRQTIFDPIGDVPGTGYDLTQVSLEKEGASLKIIFTTAGMLGTMSEASEFYLYLDMDCDPQTGRLKANSGIDYRIRYRHAKAQADISEWLAIAGTDKSADWGNTRSVSVSASTDGTAVTIWVPMIAFREDRFFCWLAESARKADATGAKLPKDAMPDFTQDPRLTVYRAWDETTRAFALEAITNTTSYSENSAGELLWSGLSPLGSTAISTTALTGDLAVPLVDSTGTPVVQIWSVADAKLVTTIPDARQPDFRQDGTRLLINQTSDGGGAVYEYTLTDGKQTPVSEGIVPTLPTYNLVGDRVVYAGASSTVSNTTVAPIYLQCSLRLPSAEADTNCRNLAAVGRLSGDKDWGDVIGSDPLWGADDQIFYRSCPVWDGSRRCGIYTISANSTLSNTTRSVPSQLLDDPSAIPTDTQGQWLTLMAEQQGDWEIYVMARDGSWIQNLSNTPNAQDGLPTFSPDGRWVAYVSNRGGEWAIWTIPSQGGEAQKLFDLPSGTLWDPETLRWASERISWGQ